MVIYKQSSFDNDVHEIDIRRFFENIGLEVQFKPSPIQKCAPNECNVYEKDRWSAGEAGYAGLGHQHLIVSPTKIYAWYNIEEDWLHKKMVAFTFAHEIGHTFLGSGHKVGSTNNVMTNAISNIEPMLQDCQWPGFDESQINKIKKKLGY